MAAFRITRHGLRPLANGVQPLGAGDAGPAEVATSTPLNGVVVVTNKTSNTIDTFAVGPSGRLGAGYTRSRPRARRPFGFAFTPLGTLVVSDAGEAPTSAATAYHLSAAGVLGVTSARCRRTRSPRAGSRRRLTAASRTSPTPTAGRSAACA